MPSGTIVKALSGFYYVKSNENKFVYKCRGRGVFRKQNITPLVGDRVDFQIEENDEGYVLAIEPRDNELTRPPIANVNQAILVFSAVEPDFSTALLDRFLVVVEAAGIKPIIVISKMDLLDQATTLAISQFAQDYRQIGYLVILISSFKRTGLDELSPHLARKISVVAGQSGVGKSALLNALQPGLGLETNEISLHLGRGKHTTRHVELLSLSGGLVADTPGFSSLTFDQIEAEDLPICFPEFLKESPSCKFRGCLHLNEPNCFVKIAVENGTIPPYRYEHYKQFLQEIQERKPRY